MIKRSNLPEQRPPVSTDHFSVFSMVVIADRFDRIMKTGTLNSLARSLSQVRHFLLLCIILSLHPFENDVYAQ